MFPTKTKVYDWETSLRHHIHREPAVYLPYLFSLPVAAGIALLLGLFFFFRASGPWALLGLRLPEVSFPRTELANIDRPYQKITPQSPAGTSPKEIFLPVKFQTYRFSSGDSLSGVANRFNLRVGTIISWNQIANARRMPVGLELELLRTMGFVMSSSVAIP